MKTLKLFSTVLLGSLLFTIASAFAYIPFQITSGANLQRIERVSVASACGSSPCTITDQSGAWVSSITRSGTGTYTIHIAAGVFTVAPTCMCIPTGGNYVCNQDVIPTTSTLTIDIANNSATPTDRPFQIMCMSTR